MRAPGRQTVHALRKARATNGGFGFLKRRKRRLRRQTYPRLQSSSTSDLDVRMMRRALELADRAALKGEVPVGAVVYRGDEIIAEGYNYRESSSDPTGHAELIAVREASRKLNRWRLSDCSLAVTLEPCPMCAGALVNARLGKLFYGARDPKAGACCSLFKIPTDTRLNHRVETVGGILAEECSRVLKKFFQSRRSENRNTKAGRKSA